MQNVLFVVSGPSGVGKGTLVKLLLEENDGLSLSVSCTSRQPRAGEVHGRDYFFLSRAEFEAKIAAGDFLEYDEHFGNYYGTPKSFVLERLKEKSVILEIDVVGALNAKRKMDGACKCVLVLVTPPDLETLANRLKARSSETEEELAVRMERVKYELSVREQYDYVVVNDDLNEAKNRLAEIIKKETIS